MTGLTRKKPLGASRPLAVILALLLTATAAAQPDRAAAIEQRIADRAQQIEENPNDPALLADQAADLYFEYLAIEASGWTAILGVPSAAQRERARRAGRDIYDLAHRAEAALERAILDLEADPRYADDLDLQRERRRLIEHERDRRIPFLIGVGASLHANAGDHTEEEKRAMLAKAMNTLKTVASRIDRPLAAHARLHAGLASANLGQVNEAQDFLDEVEANEDAEPLVLFAARLILASLDPAHPERTLDRLAAHPDYSRSTFHRLLIADRRFALRKEKSSAEALAAYTDLLGSTLDVSRAQLRDVILLRVADAMDDELSNGRLPPFAQIAVAERRLRDGSSDARLGESIVQLLERSDLSNLERSHALLTLARLHHAAGNHLAAAKAYVRLARDHKGRPEAERAIEVGLALAAQQFQVDPAAARDTLHEGLTLAIESYPRLDSIDRWRFVAGRLAISEGRYDDAIRYFNVLSADSDFWMEARVLRGQALLGAATGREGDQEAALLNELVRSHESLMRRLDSAIERADPVRVDALQRHRLQVRAQWADALVRLDEPERALEMLTGFEDEPEAYTALLGEVLEVRIRALVALGRTAEAHHQIDAFTEIARPVRIKAVVGLMLASAAGRVNDLLARGQEEDALRHARAELAPLAERLDTWMAGDRERFDAGLALRVADGYRHAQQYQPALRLYQQLLADHPNAAPILLGRAECLFHLGVEDADEARLAEAMSIYRRLLSAGAEFGETYWLAQLRSLQILDAIDRNTHQILPQIQRLRLRDPGLGGERFRPNFERLQNKYAE